MTVYVCSAFGDLRSSDIRLLHAASRYGSVEALVWSDGATPAGTRFREDERLYFVRSLRWVADARLVDTDATGLPLGVALERDSVWVCDQAPPRAEVSKRLAALGLRIVSLGDDDLVALEPTEPPEGAVADAVIATGCFDWLHSGHIRFFEEAAAFGRLFVSVGSDATIRGLKGPHHPKIPEKERLYCVASVRHVHEAFIGSGTGWLDAAPEIERIRPRRYVVNEDGDRPEKREFCRARGMEYIVLQRRPREGLPRRSSTELRGY